MCFWMKCRKKVKDVAVMQLIALVVGGVPVGSNSYAAAVCLVGVEALARQRELVGARRRTLQSAIASRSCSDFRKYSQVLEVN